MIKIQNKLILKLFDAEDFSYLHFTHNALSAFSSSPTSGDSVFDSEKSIDDVT